MSDATTLWAAIAVAALGCYLLKWIGLSLPERVLTHPRVRQVSWLLPVALLAALVAVQTFSSAGRLALDARAGGLLFAVVALVLRAPFLVVVFGAALVTALLRLV